MPTDAFTTPGDFTWTVPTGVTQILAECWGAGAGSGRGSFYNGGGGGGAYSSAQLTVTPGSTINLHVGVGGSGGATGGSPGSYGIAGADSWFSSSTTVLAKGGAGGNSTTALGGQSSVGFGDVKRSGGNGAGHAAGNGSGGGSSAGDDTNGNPGSLAAGGIAPTGGGNGGNPGGNSVSDGHPGLAPGGGGGAGGVAGNSAAGANGQVLVTYTPLPPPNPEPPDTGYVGVQDLDHSPADIIRWLLVALGDLSDPTPWASGAGSAWPGFATKEPSAPDNCVTIYNTAGQPDGRFMTNGALVWHAGLQMRVRAVDDPTCWRKMSYLRSTLSQETLQRVVHVDDEEYIVWAVTKIGAPLSIGQETPNSKRILYTLNFMAAISKKL